VKEFAAALFTTESQTSQRRTEKTEAAVLQGA